MILLTQVVLSLKKEDNALLRELAHKMHESRKGAMSKVVSKGLHLIKEEIERRKAHESLLEKARNAKNLGIGKFKRDELYDRI